MKRIILFILVLFLSGCSIKDKDNVQTLEQEDKVEIKEEEKYIDDNPIKLGIFLSDNNYSNKEVIKDTYYANLQSGVDIASFEVFFTDEEIINGSNFKNTWNKYYSNYTNIENYRIGYNVCKRQGILNGEYVVPYNPNDNTSSKALYYINKP